jgi:hypothetical protein
MKRSPRIEKICHNCKNSYLTTKPNKKFCGFHCSVIHQTNKKIYICPMCGKEKVCHLARLKWYMDRKSLCKSCHLKKMRNSKGPSSLKQRTMAKNLFKTKNPSFKIKNKIKCSRRMKLNNPTLNPAVRNKIRLSVIKDLESKHGQIHPNYNKNACKIIEQYGKQTGYNFQHAENGGEFYLKELGYWVDGYDKEKNVVVEYYEKRHKKTIIKDEYRKNDIINFLHCKFIEIKEWDHD